MYIESITRRRVRGLINNAVAKQNYFCEEEIEIHSKGFQIRNKLLIWVKLKFTLAGKFHLI